MMGGRAAPQNCPIFPKTESPFWDEHRLGASFFPVKERALFLTKLSSPVGPKTEESGIAKLILLHGLRKNWCGRRLGSKPAEPTKGLNLPCFGFLDSPFVEIWSRKGTQAHTRSGGFAKGVDKMELGRCPEVAIAKPISKKSPLISSRGKGLLRKWEGRDRG